MSERRRLKRNKRFCVNCCGLNVLVECKCGCGGIKPLINSHGDIRYYINGHNSNGQKGNNNPNWKGGICFNNNYLIIYRPDHHQASKIGYVRLHRYVYEYFHKCCILPWVEVHHINNISTDNHKHNMILLPKPEHTKITIKERGIFKIRFERIKTKRTKDHSNTVCLLCNSNKTKNHVKTNKPIWFHHRDGYICSTCKRRLRWIINNT